MEGKDFMYERRAQGHLIFVPKRQNRQRVKVHILSVGRKFAVAERIELNSARSMKVKINELQNGMKRVNA